MLYDSLSVKEEFSTGICLPQKVSSQCSDPFENGETSIGFQYEQSDCLLKEESNNDRRPS